MPRTETASVDAFTKEPEMVAVERLPPYGDSLTVKNTGLRGGNPRPHKNSRNDADTSGEEAEPREHGATGNAQKPCEKEERQRTITLELVTAEDSAWP